MLKAGLGSMADATVPVHRAAFAPPAAAELAGKFPQLEILELIGSGGMGAVYKARQKALDRFVALKILPPDVSRDPSFAERFVREAKVLAKLNHPNIVTLYEFGETEGLYYFLMEYVEGVNLRQLLGAGKIPPKEALAIVPPICDALQFAHDRGIVHRDIKPENILLNKDGQVKIADFGVAKIVGSDAASDPSVRADPSEVPVEVTEAGSVIGTPRYMAPEQRDRPGEVDHRADIYSLGVVFYQMLTGELPAHKLEAPSKKIQIDVRLDEVVLRALDKNPERRYQHASDVKTMVQTVAGTLAAGMAPVVVHEPPRCSRAAIAGACWAPFALFAVVAVLTVKVGPVSHSINSVPASLQPLFLFQLVLAGLLAVVVSAKLKAVTLLHKAAIGFCLVAVMLMAAPWWFQVTSGDCGVPAWQTAAVLVLVAISVTAPFGTTVLGWLGVAHIRRSEGRLYGLRLAVFDGLLFPLLTLDAMIVAGGVAQKVSTLTLALIVGLVDVLLVQWAWKTSTAPKGNRFGADNGIATKRPTQEDLLHWKRSRLLLSIAAVCSFFAALTVPPHQGKNSSTLLGLFVVAMSFNVAAAVKMHRKIREARDVAEPRVTPAACGSSPVVPPSEEKDLGRLPGSTRLDLWAYPVFLALYAGLATFWVSSFGDLPERVATHFGFNGQPDGWMSRRTYLAFEYGFPALIAGLFAGLSALVRVLPAWCINIPRKDYWLAPERRALTGRLLRDRLGWLLCLLTLFFGGLHVLIVQANRDAPPQLPMGGLLLLIIAFFVGLMIWMALLLMRFAEADAARSSEPPLSATTPGSTTQKPRNWRKGATQLLIGVALALAVKTWVLGSYRVSGDSLSPEIPRGSYVLAWKPAATFRSGDLIVYRHEGRILGGRVEGSDAASLDVNRNGMSAERIARKTVCGRIITVLWRGSGQASK